MRNELTLAVVATLAGACSGRGSPSPRPAAEPVALREVAANELRAVADFAAIADRTARSQALFVEMSRVLTHPRCINCHPSDDVPRQRMEMQLHDPPVQRGPEDRGVVGMQCAGCHQEHNQWQTRVPGAPEWHLAPIEMAWVGKSVAEICAQIKDPARNGGKSLAQIVEHNGHDKLVAWGWAPGADREPVPGTQEQFGALTAAWVETGAACPGESK